MEKINEELGFSIESALRYNAGVFVSVLKEGGPADLTAGQVKVGDKILVANGVDLSNATHDEAVQVLKNTGNEVHLTLFYKPIEYTH